MKIASSGYVTQMHVTARRDHSDADAMIVGTACGQVPPFVDTHEVLELLATEAMLAACEPTLLGHGHRDVDVSTSL